MQQLALLLDLSPLMIDSIDILGITVRLELHNEQPEANCPLCGHLAHRVQSRYRRTLTDVPLGGKHLHLGVWVRRFFCENPSCERRIFAERLDDLASPYARRTQRLTQALAELGFVLGGKAGAQLAADFGMSGSRETILRIVRHTAMPAVSTPRILGVDEWAFRRSKRYGTLLVDLERGIPVDLLPDREAATLATWLREHPDVLVISRDRGGEYALGAQQGAPEALQIADRFHLVLNLADVGQRILRHHRKQLKQIQLTSAAPASPMPSVRLLRPGREREKQRNRQERQARYESVRELSARGMTMQHIARCLHLDRKTVATFVHASTFPERSELSPRANRVAPYAAYLLTRWQEGARQTTGLWREITARGYSGSRKPVERFLHGLRTMQEQGIDLTSSVTMTEMTPRRAVSLMLRHPEDLTAEETLALKQIGLVHPDVQRTQILLQQFLQMLRQRRGEELESWLTAAFHADIPEFRPFVRKLRQDQMAVQAGLTLKWNNGPVEGQINRLKLLKRSMYGRANFDLLRQRVLYHQ